VHGPSPVVIIINIAESLGARRIISLASSLKNHEGESFEGKAKCTTRGGEPNAASPGATFSQRIDGSSSNFGSGKHAANCDKERNWSEDGASEKREADCSEAAVEQRNCNWSEAGASEAREANCSETAVEQRNWSRADASEGRETNCSEAAADWCESERNCRRAGADEGAKKRNVL
jgi:hypothetical protein